MTDVYIVDAAMSCALGSSLAQVWPLLIRGSSAIGPVEPFAAEGLEFHQAACVADLEAGDEPNRVCALMRQALDQLRPVPANTMVIWTGVKGNAEYIEAKADRTPAPTIHLPRQYRRWACEQLGIEDRGMELNAACISSAAGLAVGAQMIQQNEHTNVLVCAADIVSRFTFTGFAALRALSPTPCRPFDTYRDGLTLGDGAVAVLLSAESSLDKCGSKPLARLTGWGVTNDANHITGPARDGGGLKTAIESALLRAGMDHDNLEAWCAHGTGTAYSDAMELTALERVFGSRRFPAFSIKGAVGHTPGAAGAMGAVICPKALREKTVPAPSGSTSPEPRAEGRVIDKPRTFPGRNILTTNSGFGGVNAALMLETAEEIV